MKRAHLLIPASLCLSLLLCSPIERLTAQGKALTIVVIEGEAAVNIIQQRTAVSPVIEVRDGNDLPVAGALVRFSIAGGKNATFAGGVQTLSVTTNAAGQAVAAGFTPTASGAVQIAASATFQGQTAAITIAQTNVMTAAQAAAVSATGGASGGSTAAGTGAAGGAGSGGGLSLTTIGIVGGAAAGGIVAAQTLTGASTPTEGYFRNAIPGVAVAGTGSETSSAGVTCTRAFQQLVFMGSS